VKVVPRLFDESSITLFMKKIFFLALLIMPFIAQSQSTKINEIGLNFAGINTLGVRYRTGSEISLLRLTINSAFGQHDKSPSENYKSNNSNLGFNVGFEKRKLISDNSGLYCGAELLFSYGNYNYKYEYSPTSITTEQRNSISTGLGLVFGFFYKINNHLDLSAEVVPSIRYATSSQRRNSNNDISKITTTEFLYGLNNYSITFAYRLGK
jgi:hypothetical protein